MNYPVWDVAFGAGLLIAIVAILHVFVSHFAIGGAIAANVLMARALRNENICLAGYSVLGIPSAVILSMMAISEILRPAYLEPYFQPEQFSVKTQCSVFPLFPFHHSQGCLLVRDAEALRLVHLPGED